MRPAARSVDNVGCPEHGSATSTLGPLGSSGVFINGVKAVRLGDQVDCPVRAQDVVAEGASMVRLGGLPMSAASHRAVHPAKITTGSPDVNIGGPTFALPSNLTIGGPAAFRNKVIRDLWLLSQTPTGKEMLSRLERTGQLVVIQPQLSGERGSGCDPNPADKQPTGSIIFYDASEGLAVLTPEGGLTTAPPQTGLGHELIHATRLGEGKALLNHKHEEATVRGDGAFYRDESITENGLRDDLGLEKREGIELLLDGPARPASGPKNLRPGGY
jgi:uncharacterized Zn-binding protein involved in type VI secretion